MIEVQHLTKRYGRITAVDDVSFRVERGEILGFLGPNGAGKTTTMRILTGYMPATEGKALVAGFDVFDQPVEAKRRTGYLPETPPLYPDMTVLEYLRFVAKIKGVPSAERRQRIQAVMERTRIADMANRLCGNLSKGYKQRVGLAQALIHNPDVLILDEPTAGLDPKQIIETRELIKGLAGDHTIVLSTHILPEVSQTCQRVVIIAKGKVVAVDTPDNLTARLQGSEMLYVQVDSSGADVSAVLGSVAGVIRIAESDRKNGVVGYEVESERGQDIRRELARTIVGSGWGLLELRPTRISLEEIFLKLTTVESDAAPVEQTGTEEQMVANGNTLAIAHKELRAYFVSPIAYVIIGGFAFLYGYFYIAILSFFVRQSMQMLQMGGPPTANINEMMIRPLMQNVTVLVLFVMPMITMRTYSEEKRSGTIELLLTSPLTDLQIVLGKFLGAMALYVVMLAVTLIHVAILFIYGNPEWKPIATAYLGLLLLGGSFISLGLFISSLTKNQIVAAMITFAVFLFLWIITWIGSVSGPTVSGITTYLSIIDLGEDFWKGVIDTTHLIYYLSFITFGLFLTVKSVDSERWRG